MKCAAFHKMIGDRLDGTIRPADRARLEAHLAACAECRELMDDFRIDNQPPIAGLPLRQSFFTRFIRIACTPLNWPLDGS